MNPLDYWYRTNSDLRIFINEYYLQNINLLTSGKVKSMCKELFEKGNLVEKIQVLTLLAAWRLYFEN
jgi:asparagine synthase (glutamine-hydrolysing)